MIAYIFLPTENAKDQLKEHRTLDISEIKTADSIHSPYGARDESPVSDTVIVHSLIPSRNVQNSLECDGVIMIPVAISNPMKNEKKLLEFDLLSLSSSQMQKLKTLRPEATRFLKNSTASRTQRMLSAPLKTQTYFTLKTNSMSCTMRWKSLEKEPQES